MVKIFVIFANFVKREKNGYTGLCTYLNIPLFKEICSTRLDLPITFNYEFNLS